MSNQNNPISGAHSSNNQTNHSALTSDCRMASGADNSIADQGSNIHNHSHQGRMVAQGSQDRFVPPNSAGTPVMHDDDQPFMRCNPNQMHSHRPAPYFTKPVPVLEKMIHLSATENSGYTLVEIKGVCIGLLHKAPAEGAFGEYRGSTNLQYLEADKDIAMASIAHEEIATYLRNALRTLITSVQTAVPHHGQDPLAVFGEFFEGFIRSNFEKPTDEPLESAKQPLTKIVHDLCRSIADARQDATTPSDLIQVLLVCLSLDSVTDLADTPDAKRFLMNMYYSQLPVPMFNGPNRSYNLNNVPPRF